MTDRSKSVRAEMERKKQLLAQLKEERERKARMARENNENREPGSSNISFSRDKTDDADGILEALGVPSSSLSRASTVPSNVSGLDTSRSGLSNFNTPDKSLNFASTSQQQLHEKLSTSLGDPHHSSQNLSSLQKSSVSLQVVHVNQINIPPKERVYYSKCTQTATDSTNSNPESEDPLITAEEPIPTKPINTKQYRSTTNNSSAQTNSPVRGPHQPMTQQQQLIHQQQQQLARSNSNQSATNSLNTSSVTSTVQQLALEWDDEFPEYISSPELRTLSEEERRQVEFREDYQQFVDRATKIMERALHHNESPEIFIHYFPDGSKDAVDNDQRSGSKLSFNRIFYDEKWSRNRCVTGFDWSAQYPELLLASYYSNEQSLSDPDGTLLVWNMRFKNTSPEYIFHCQSAIMSCCFAKFHPSLIVGGTYSGQIVLWDMRSNKKTPVQRSSLTTASHTHPVYCTKVVGTQNAHNLISISTDGKLCSWSLDMLSAHQETMELNQEKQTRSVAVTCMSFHPDDYNNFLVGSEDGMVYSACRHGSKTGITNSFKSHQGYITNVDFRPIDTQSGYSRLFLTSSIDWTVKLWDTKEPQPIHTFESNGDYVYDVKWSPNNPTLFATADGNGRVDIWNLANDSELPTASTQIEPVSVGESRINPSLNKLIWTPSGNQVVVGDNTGRIHVYDIGDVGDMGAHRRQEDQWELAEHITRVKI